MAQPHALAGVPARRTDRDLASAADWGFRSGRRNPKLGGLASDRDDAKLLATAGD